VDADLWATALREAEEEACVDVRPLVAALPAPALEVGSVRSGPGGVAYGVDAVKGSPGEPSHVHFWLRLPDACNVALAGRGTDCTVVVTLATGSGGGDGGGAPASSPPPSHAGE
jgi:hypothetical protein